MPIVTLLTLLLILPVCWSVIYRRFFHGLAAVPGPRLAAVTSLWYAYHVRNGHLLRLAQTLHEKYGPVVRVSPDELWFDSAEAFKVIYNPSHGFEKSTFYLATALFRPRMSWLHPFRVASPDTLDLLSERDTKRYRLQRRLIGPVYHEANMQKFAPAVDAVLQRAVAELRQLDGARVDLKEWMHIIAVECLGAVVLSWSPGFVRDRSDHGSSAAGYYNWRRKSVFGLFPALVVADLHTRWVSRCFAAVWRLGYERRADYKPLFATVGQRVAMRIRKALRPAKAQPARVNKSKKPKPPPPRAGDLMTDLLDLYEAKPAFTETYLRRLAVTNFGAGHETLCSALTAIVAMIGSHPHVFRRVAAEIRQTADDDNDNDNDNDVTIDVTISTARNAHDRLPFTWASIREAQRLHPAIAMSLSRTVPPVGTGSGLVCLHGYVLPPGTTVGCSPAALHRSRAIFGDDADVFRPERWLDCANTNEVQLRDMDRYNLTWGGGSRTCPGRHLAEMVVLKTVVALFRAFDVEAVMPADEQIRYYFLAMLTGAKAEFRVREKHEDAAELQTKEETTARRPDIPGSQAARQTDEEVRHKLTSAVKLSQVACT